MSLTPNSLPETLGGSLPGNHAGRQVMVHSGDSL